MANPLSITSLTPKSERTRLLLLNSGVEEIIANGVDKVGFTAVARRVGMSTGALYARYENADEFLVDIWSELCEPVIVDAMRTLIHALENPEDQDAILAVASLVNAPSATLRAGVNILSVVRRNDTLREVIEASLVARVEPVFDRHPTLSILVAHALGMVVIGAGLPSVEFDWTALVTAIVLACARAKPKDVTRFDVPWSSLEYNFADELEGNLFEGVAEVMAAAGFEHATVSRIARRSRVNPAVIYMRYADKYELMCRCIELVSHASAQRASNFDDLLANEELAARVSAEVTRRNASPDYRSIRLMRLEALLVAAHRSDVAATLVTAFNDYLGEPAAEVQKATGGDIRLIRGMVLQGRAVFFGQAMLIEFELLEEDNEYLESFYEEFLEICHGWYEEATKSS